MKVLAPTYFKNFKCKCKECRNSCCKDKWRIILTADDIERLKNLHDPSINSSLLIDKENNEGCFKKDENGSCPFLDTDGLCKIQKKYGEDALAAICKNYPRNIYTYRDCASTHLATGNSCEKTLELLFNMDKYTLETIDYDFGNNQVMEIDSILEDKQKHLIELLNDENNKLSDILINSFCSQIVTNKSETEISSKQCFKFLLSLTFDLAKQSINFAQYHNTIIKQLISNNEILFDKYELAKTKFANNPINKDRFLRNVLCNYIFHGHLFANPAESETTDYIKICLAYIIIKFVTTLNFFDSNNIDKYIDCIASYFKAFQNSNKMQIFLLVLKASNLSEKQLLATLIKLL